MHTSCAMMSSRVTPLVEEEGADVDGAVEARGIAVLDRLTPFNGSGVYGTHDMEVVRNGKGNIKMA